MRPDCFRRRCLVRGMATGLGAGLLTPWTAWAQTPPPEQPPAPPPEVAAALPEARLQGSARLTFLTLHVYDARLWSAQPLPADFASAPLALELAYARGLSGAQIAERSLKEMRGVGNVDPADGERWLAAMKQLFPDVRKGDRITGLNLPNVGARFFLNGNPRGEVRETAFAALFFGIWLSPKTSEPAMRTQLLGAGAAKAGAKAPA